MRKLTPLRIFQILIGKSLNDNDAYKTENVVRINKHKVSSKRIKDTDKYFRKNKFFGD